MGILLRLAQFISTRPKREVFQTLLNALKSTLERSFLDAGIPTKTNPDGISFSGLTRISIEELEAWYFGNWKAACRAYSRLPSTVAKKAKYRNSDNISGGTWEAFERECKKAGFFSSGLRKIEAAREIGLQIAINENTSPSLQKFYDGLLLLLGD
ncbi:DUF4276 family protein [Salipiger mucosus]|uniref:DUF4276 family protein n=1 Tax=Salipiger mucosus TaxID=263378 RepID=UPI001FDEF39B|nr:DUF4276 family protein [Salipiger mucosus]